MSVWLTILFTALVVADLAIGLIWLDHHLTMKRIEKAGEVITDKILPTAEIEMEIYTERLMEQTKKMTTEWIRTME